MGPEPGPGALRPAGPGVGASVPASPRLDLATPGPLHPDGRSPTESCAWRRGEVGGGFLHGPLHRPLVPFPSRSGSRRPPPHPSPPQIPPQIPSSPPLAPGGAQQPLRPLPGGSLRPPLPLLPPQGPPQPFPRAPLSGAGRWRRDPPPQQRPRQAAQSPRAYSSAATLPARGAGPALLYEEPEERTETSSA